MPISITAKVSDNNCGECIRNDGCMQINKKASKAADLFLNNFNEIWYEIKPHNEPMTIKKDVKIKIVLDLNIR